MTAFSLRDALKTLPVSLSEPLIDEFEQGLAEFRAADWEKVGLKAGKFCEIAYCICAGHATGNFPLVATKPKNFLKSCLDLEIYNKTRGRSLCIQIPRILIGLYELRNNRAIGHVDGEVSPNHMDAEFFLRGMKWAMAEFVRFFSQLPLTESHALVEGITVRAYNIVWSNGHIRRVLEPARTAGERVLILLYSEGKPVDIATLRSWVEYSNSTDFKRKILRNLHEKALINFDEAAGKAEILPPGQAFVETSGLLVVAGK